MSDRGAALLRIFQFKDIIQSYLKIHQWKLKIKKAP